MCKKIIAYTTIGLAILLAILASTLSPEHLGQVLFFVKFFEVMIPVLAVGALIKYLFSYCCCSKVCEEKEKK
jgi:hypothetical protein